jgi:putative flippase GtrA
MDIVTYLFFGVLTTIVNYMVYFPLYNWVGCSAVLSNAIAWLVAVVFAFLTNKPFVFKSHDWSAKTVMTEVIKFFGCRIASGIAESVIIFVTVDLMLLNGNLWKILTSVLVIVLNYIGSKVFVFRRKR